MSDSSDKKGTRKAGKKATSTMEGAKAAFLDSDLYKNNLAMDVAKLHPAAKELNTSMASCAMALPAATYLGDLAISMASKSGSAGNPWVKPSSATNPHPTWS